MTALAAYYDESMREAVQVVAGYIGAVEMWDELFSPAWNDVLRKASCRRGALTEYHASDCFNRRGEFRDWSPSDSESLTADLSALIADFAARRYLAGHVTCIVYPAVVDPAHKFARRYRKLVDHHAYGHLLGLNFYYTISHGAQSCDDDFTVQPVPDKREKFYERMMINYTAICEVLGSQLSAKVKTPVPGDSKDLPPIQAADLLAFEANREMWNRQNGEDARQALVTLVESGSHRGYVLTLPLIEQVRSGKRENWPLLFDAHRPIRDRGLFRMDSD